MHDSSRDTKIESAPRRTPDRSRDTASLLSLVDAAWPSRLPRRDIAGLPPAVARPLPISRHTTPFLRAAAHLDQTLPGWTELAAEAVARAAADEIAPDLQRLAVLLAHRPLRRPDILLDVLPASPESRLWPLVALAGTDTAPVRAAWLGHLRAWMDHGETAADPAIWFAFLHAFLHGWLTYSDFRAGLARGVLNAAAPNGDYAPALHSLGLHSNTRFSKWYRQVVYETAHQPDASLSLQVGGWIRDFPGEHYLWDALTQLAQKPHAWWPLHLVRWTSEIDPEAQPFIERLRKISPLILCLLSLLRPDLAGAAGRALDAPEHESVVEWLKSARPSDAPNIPWITRTVRPWAEDIGGSLLLATGALCSIDPPSDYPGPEREALRRRAFLRAHFLPQLDRLLDNLCYLYALRKEHFHVIEQYARSGRPAALRALALWPEKAEEAAQILFPISRGGPKLARQAAGEALHLLRLRTGVEDLEHLEKRVDLASAWADAGLEGKPARVWWEVAGYRVRLSIVGGAVKVRAYSGTRPLASLPRRVREDDRYPEIRSVRAELAKTYRYFRRRFQEAMIRGTHYTGSDFAVLLANPVVRSLASRLLLSVDGEPHQWNPEDPLDDSAPPKAIARAGAVSILHPLDLRKADLLDHWQQQVIDLRIAQPFKQVFRELYLVGEEEAPETLCSRFAGHPLIARRAFALLRGRGYTPRRGDALKQWPRHQLRAHITWAKPEENAGRLLAQVNAAESVTSGPVWFESEAGEQLPLGGVPPLVFSETLRDADLLVSRAAAGELGFTSEGTRAIRASLLRYLARALGVTTIYVGEGDLHVLVEGQRAMYRVHLGSGSVLLEKTRRHLDLTSVHCQPVESLLEESIDSFTARLIGVVIALSRDDQITDPAFLKQLHP